MFAVFVCQVDKDVLLDWLIQCSSYHCFFNGILVLFAVVVVDVVVVVVVLKDVFETVKR